MAGRRSKAQTTLHQVQVEAILVRLRACREEAVYAEVRSDLPLAGGLEMLIRTIDATAGVLTGHTRFLMPMRDVDNLPPRSRAEAPPNRQLLIDAMSAARGETTSAHIDFHSPPHSAFNMLQRAIDAVALLLTGQREFIWAKGSSHIDLTRANLEAAEARARELAARDDEDRAEP